MVISLAQRCVWAQLAKRHAQHCREQGGNMKMLAVPFPHQTEAASPHFLLGWPISLGHSRGLECFVKHAAELKIKYLFSNRHRQPQAVDAGCPPWGSCRSGGYRSMASCCNLSCPDMAGLQALALLPFFSTGTGDMAAHLRVQSWGAMGQKLFWILILKNVFLQV